MRHLPLSILFAESGYMPNGHAAEVLGAQACASPARTACPLPRPRGKIFNGLGNGGVFGIPLVKVRDGEGAVTSRRGACAPQTSAITPRYPRNPRLTF